MNPDETQLIEEARSGSVSAFEAIYRQHVDRIYAICLRLSRNPERSKDLTQEVFLRAWSRLGSFRGESRLGTWLQRVAVNSSLDDHRRRKHDACSMDEVDLEGLMVESRRSMPGTNIDIERAIAELPGGAREAVILRDIEGYRYAEIAEMLEVSEGTVKSQINRGRRLIREAMER